jgi:hypothetical protein
MDVTQKFSVQLFVYHVICSPVENVFQCMYLATAHAPEALGLERNEDQVGEMVENEKELYKKTKAGEEVRIGPA